MGLQVGIRMLCGWFVFRNCAIETVRAFDWSRSSLVEFPFELIVDILRRYRRYRRTYENLPAMW